MPLDYSAAPEYWDSYLPQLDDYGSQAEWADAVRAGSQDTSDPHGRYWDPIGQTWRGGRRTEREIALSEFDAGRFMDVNNTFNKGPYSQMRLQNRIGFDPEAARMAYHAYDEFGNPLLDPAILAIIEQALGIEANQPPVEGAPVNGAGTPTLPKLGMPTPGGNPGNKPPPDFSGGAGGNSPLPPGIEMPSQGFPTQPDRMGSAPMPLPGLTGYTGAGGPITDGPATLPDWGFGGSLTGHMGAGGPITDGPATLPDWGFSGPLTGQASGDNGRSMDGVRPADWVMERSATSTIDPRYPDFILRGGLRGQNKWGPRPTNARQLGGY